MALTTNNLLHQFEWPPLAWGGHFYVRRAHSAGVGPEVVIVHQTGGRSHLLPEFLKFPMSSRFLLSTLCFKSQDLAQIDEVHQ
jgi:hypothetical protein